jgi:hypothetical protein
VEPKLEPRVEYNISHDHEHVLLGISRTGKIGVDLMSIPANPADIEEALSDQVSHVSFSAEPGDLMEDDDIGKTRDDSPSLYTPEVREIDHTLVREGGIC